MISSISGKISKKKESSVVLCVNGISYEILVPVAIMKTLGRDADLNSDISVITYYYHQVEPSRSVPVLIGFLNEIEKEFFEKFITVSGIGPRAAVRALSLPFSTIADAIDRGDLKALKTLPGIGEQKAREIVAKLQGKVGKFGLIQDRGRADAPKGEEDMKEEALQVLLQLQYKKTEAGDMIDKAIGSDPSVKTCEDILNVVYKQKGK